MFDGQVVLSGEAALFTATKGDIFVGSNPFGGSTTESLFHGQIRIGHK
jgi:hypothetical protein